MIPNIFKDVKTLKTHTLMDGTPHVAHVWEYIPPAGPILPR